MSTRRVLVALIASLSAFICLAGAGVAGLAFFGLSGSQAPVGELLVLDDTSLRLLGPGGAEREVAGDLSGEVFHYPALAPDGERVAYISRDADGVALSSLHLGTGERNELYRSPDAPPLYATWSPDGRTISFLSNRRGGGLGVLTVPADGSAEAALLSSTVGSSYFAWRPDGGGLLLHVGGSSFEGGAVVLYTGGLDEPARELRDPGFFQAPAWSADGDAFFYVAQPPVDGPMRIDAVESVLTRVAADGGEPRALAVEQGAGIIFSRSPTGDDIAYITRSPSGFGPLKVVDAAGGGPREVSRSGQAVLAFFWAPDGTRLAYLTFAPQAGGLPLLTWHVVDRAGGEPRELSSFTPSQAFVGLLNYFDAYAFALDLWSPDGTRLAYGTDEGVYVVEVASGEAARRADGSLGLWVGR